MEKLPLLWLVQQSAKPRAPVDMGVLMSQLGVLPDLRYLVEGLQRSRQCIFDFQDELRECLRAVPGPRLEPQQLIDGIDHLLTWCDAQAWREDDPPRLRMGRRGAGASHPLKGHCLSVSFHWPNLFYTLEPEGVPRGGTDSAISYEALMAEFSAYVIAAQSTIDPEDYLGYCKKWWSSEQLPPHTAFPDRRLASRVASASRAMRRLGLQQHHALYGHLADPRKGDHFHARVSRALRRELKWNEGDDQLLNAIALLLEEVRPGWSRTGYARRRGGGGKRPGKRVTRRRNYRDGYVRILGEAIRTITATDAGAAIEHTCPLPTFVEALTQELIDEWLAQIESEPDKPAAREHFVNGKRPSRAQLRVEAENEARILVDGLEWLPADEAVDNPGMESILLGQEVDGGELLEPGRQTSKWAAQHIRRAQFAHGLGPNRLNRTDTRQLLKCIRETPADSADKITLVALHACLALGRPLSEITALHILEGKPPPQVAADRIHYSIASRVWMVPCPAPAWLDKERDPDERPQWSILWLWDKTGFADLLKHFGLAHEGQPFQKLTEGRKRAAEAFLKVSLPHAGATLSQCSDFLFYELLACSQGDLGIASLITGHEHSHSRSIRHYANYPSSHAWRAYRRAWDFVQGSNPSDRSSNAMASSSKNDRGGFGAKRVPTVDSVRRVFAHLAQVTRFGESATERRNAFTAYTFAGLVLALGMRPVVEPLIKDIIGSSENALLPTYIDKARSDYDRRVNAIPKQLTEHLYRYVTFRKQLAVTGPERVRRAAFVYIDSEGLFERFRPSDFQKVTGKAFSLELYSFRRFLRTELRCTYAVHAEDVDAWMGHWFQRLSPHDRLSTYPLCRLLALGEGAISDLLESVGFRPLAPPR